MLVLITILSGCGEYVPADEVPENPDPSDEPVVNPPSEDLADDPTAFTVAIRLYGRLYKPKEGEKIVAYWSNGFSLYAAEFGSDGYARIKDLDGDYNVTLKGLPDEYVYNPNAYVATNDDRTVIIDIYKPVLIDNEGCECLKTGNKSCKHIYTASGCASISTTTLYRVEIKSSDHIVYIEYAPESSGTYTVESWMNTSEGAYNPLLNVMSGASHAYKNYAYTLDGGGYCDGYTQNFKHIVEIADEHIGETGQAVFTFGVRCDSKNGVYPVYVDFAIQLNGSFSLDHADKELLLPEESLIQTPDYSSSEYEWKWAETETKGVEGRYQFDGDMFKLWATKDGGDGFYHVYDETLYRGYTGPDGRVYADGYGPILYAKISSPHRFTEAPFTTIESAGNSSLTVYGNMNHKLFIQGIVPLLVDPGLTNPQATSGSYFCDRFCPCRKDKSCIGVCSESCMKCLENCRKLPDEVMEEMINSYFCVLTCPCKEDYQHEGVCAEGCVNCSEKCSNIPSDIYELFSYGGIVFPYELSALGESYEGKYLIKGTEGGYAVVDSALMGLSSYTNLDGVYGVTEQIKTFLQGFSITQRYFADGQGWVETHETYKVDAKEADQWLFACGYYVKK